MATYTRIELRTQVMAELGMDDAIEAADAAEARVVNDRIQQVLEYLNDQGLIPFDLDSDAIPAPYMQAITPIVAARLVSTYGLSQRKALIEADAERGMRDLRRLKAQPYYGTPVQATYF